MFPSISRESCRTRDKLQEGLEEVAPACHTIPATEQSFQEAKRRTVPKAGILPPVHKGRHGLGYLQFDSSTLPSATTGDRGVCVRSVGIISRLPCSWAGWDISSSISEAALPSSEITTAFSKAAGSVPWGRPVGPELSRPWPGGKGGGSGAAPAGGSTARPRAALPALPELQPRSRRLPLRCFPGVWNNN